MKGAKVKNCRLRGPLSIGEKCIIEDCYIGLFTSIYHNTQIRDCEIENSIIMGDVQISDIMRRVDSSLIGWGAEINKMNNHVTCINLLVGDQSVVKL